MGERRQRKKKTKVKWGWKQRPAESVNAAMLQGCRACVKYPVLFSSSVAKYHDTKSVKLDSLCGFGLLSQFIMALFDFESMCYMFLFVLISTPLDTYLHA